MSPFNTLSTLRFVLHLNLYFYNFTKSSNLANIVKSVSLIFFDWINSKSDIIKVK